MISETIVKRFVTEQIVFDKKISFNELSNLVTKASKLSESFGSFILESFSRDSLNEKYFNCHFESGEELLYYYISFMSGYCSLKT